MEGVTALRAAARDAIFSAGGRGFVRFCAEGDALLVSDAVRRGDAQALVRGLKDAGFECSLCGGLLYITPGDALLLRFCMAQPEKVCVRWDSPLFEAMALCERLLGEAPLALDAGGRRLVIKTARLLWQPKDQALSGLADLRAMIAVRLREGKRGGLHEVGRLLCGWLEDNKD